MEKLKVLLVDEAFRGQNYTNHTWIGDSPIEWIRNENITDESPLVIYTDDTIWQDKKGKIKVVWLFEGRSLKPVNYEYVETIGRDSYDYIFTWDKQLMDKFPEKAIFIPYGGSYISEDEMQIYPKTKNLAIIASTKEKLPGHILRQEVIAKHWKQIDGVFGRGRQGFELDSVLPGYKDYRFSLVIENESRDYGFSEKLTTAMLCGNVPIYFGCPSIGKFFNEKGIIQFEKLEDLDDILPTLTEERYKDMLPFVQENFEKAKELVLMENTVAKVVNELLAKHNLA